MTTLAATTAMIDVLGHQAAPAVNPVYNPAFLSGNGILGWLGRTGMVRALIARKANRDLSRAMARLSNTSPHLIADVARPDAQAMTEAMAPTARASATPRPARRPAIAQPQRASARGTRKVQAPSASMNHLAAH